MATKHHVHIENMAFAPSPLIVVPGDCVEFHNHENMTHTVTDDDATFDSGDINAGMSWEHVFDVLGEVNYHCKYHEDMCGVIMVVET